MLYFTAVFSKLIAMLLSTIFMIGLPMAGMPAPTLRGGVTITAHSGAVGLPDNSIAAMAAGAAAGAEIVEFDLNFRADGTPVLSHNDPGEEECATLEEAFAFLAKNPHLQANVDVKSTAFIEKVQPMAQEAGVLDQLFFTGLDETTIPIAAAACPDIPYYLNVKEIAEDEDFAALADKVVALGAIGVNLDYRRASAELSAAMHEKGLLVSVWTVSHLDEAVQAVRTGADNITTYRPILVRALVPRVC